MLDLADKFKAADTTVPWNVKENVFVMSEKTGKPSRETEAEKASAGNSKAEKYSSWN